MNASVVNKPHFQKSRAKAKNELITAYLKGVLLGPLAVIPASTLLFIAASSPFLSFDRFTHGLTASIYISVWGTCVAYALTITYGTALWFILLKIKKLNLVWLLAGSLLPSLIVMLYGQSVGFTVLYAYYSLAVCFCCWFVGLRQLGSQ